MGYMNAAQTVENLRASLEELRDAARSNAYEKAETLVTSYDQSVRQLFEPPVGTLSRLELERLLALQHAVMDEITQLRDNAAQHLRAGRTSLRAAHAYLKAESLA